MRLDGKPVPLELQLAFFSRGINSQALIGYVRTLEDNVIVIAGRFSISRAITH